MICPTCLSPVRYLWLLGLAILAACASEPNEECSQPAATNSLAEDRSAAGSLQAAPCDPVERLPNPKRIWHFGTYPLNGGPEDVGAVDSQVGGVVQKFKDFGVLRLPIDDSRIALAEVFSSADGVTYYVLTKDAPGARGSNVQLEQLQSFKKNSADGTLTLTVTGINLEAADDNVDPVCTLDFCEPTLNAGVDWEVLAFNDSTILFHGLSSVGLFNLEGKWAHHTTQRSTHAPLWQFRDFVINFSDNDQSLARPGRVTLAHSLPVDVDISKVKEGEEFTVLVVANAWTYNLSRRESYLAAFFRDPASLGGSMVQFTGLEPTNRPLPRPQLGIFGAAPPCTVPNPAAGTLQFSRIAYETGESPITTDPITIVRTGGTSGEVSVTFTTQDGSAAAGQDYVAVATTIAFPDGDDLPRSVKVPLLPNTVADANRTVVLQLSEPGGCATLGNTSSVLTIHDDESPVTPTPAFTIGGTVSGLTGSGLELSNSNTGELLAVSNGPFSFAQQLPDSFAYRVVVATQPTGPAQVCTVANGSGTVAGADVSNIAVACVTPVAVTGLDSAFGGDGKVTTVVNTGRLDAVVLQPDGKIVAAGRGAPTGSFAFALARYRADGNLDSTFGTGGIVSTPFTPGRGAEAADLALQSDGKIVAVGFADDAGFDPDFAVARYNPNGTLDGSFGTGGIVTTDFGGGTTGNHFAQSVVVQPDGKILVAGHASLGATGTGHDFALARYKSDGSLDSTFGTGGKVTTNLVGSTDFGMAVALQADGRIVVGGRSAGTAQALLARYKTDGGLDSTFGGDGIATTDPRIAAANGLVIQSNGNIVIAGFAGLSGTGAFDFALARLDPSGTPDPGFGTDGFAFTDLSGGDDLAEDLVLQPDGKVVLIGRRTSGASTDLAITRYLANGTLDTSFGTGGKVEVDFSAAGDLGQGIGVQADGKVVGVGSASNGTASDFAVVRVLP